MQPRVGVNGRSPMQTFVADLLGTSSVELRGLQTRGRASLAWATGVGATYDGAASIAAGTSVRALLVDGRSKKLGKWPTATPHVNSS